MTTINGIVDSPHHIKLESLSTLNKIRCILHSSAKETRFAESEAFNALRLRVSAKDPAHYQYSAHPK